MFSQEDSPHHSWPHPSSRHSHPCRRTSTPGSRTLHWRIGRCRRRTLCWIQTVWLWKENNNKKTDSKSIKVFNEIEFKNNFYRFRVLGRDVQLMSFRNSHTSWSFVFFFLKAASHLVFLTTSRILSVLVWSILTVFDAITDQRLEQTLGPVLAHKLHIASTERVCQWEKWTGLNVS